MSDDQKRKPSTQLDGPITFDPAEAELAVSQEEAERLQAENQYLKSRVVNLRALVNRLNAERAEPTEAGSGIDQVDTPD